MASSARHVGLAVPLLLRHLAAQSGTAQAASKGRSPGIAGTPTLLLGAWACRGGVHLISGLEEGRALMSEPGSGVEGGADPAGACTQVAEECRTSETQDRGNHWLEQLWCASNELCLNEG